ncbi:MAG: hypothetical protein ABJN42_29780 [Roseibium sp.]|uniref:hypothetical protein n=1 Tax=Roseibium sp. TaxID=1936156 RepID=UPI00329A6E4B
MSFTRISYQYRDADNFKTGATLFLQGLISDETKERMRAHCNNDDGQEHFIPGQVGLQDLQDSFVTPSKWMEDRDHPWHELEMIEDVHVDTLPKGTATLEVTAEEFAQSFLATSWDDDWKPEFYDDMKSRNISDDELGLDF